MSFADGMRMGMQAWDSAEEAKRLKKIEDRAEQQRAELARIADAKPEQSEGFTPEQGEQLRAAADSGQYDVGYDDTKKSYTVTPKADPSITGNIGMQGMTEFLGKRTQGAMTDGQVSGTRQRAMADVVMKSDPLAGTRMLRDVQQGEQSDQMFALNKQHAERVGRADDRAEAHETGRQQIFNSSIFGQKNAAFAKRFGDYTAAKSQYDQALAGGAPAEQLGAPPQPPSRPTYSIAESLADQGTLLAYDAQHNKVDAKTFGDFTERLRKVEDEGYLKALNLAQGGGSLDAVAKAFNASGAVQFDPRSVTSDTLVAGVDGVPERVITFKDPNGSSHSINVMSELKALGKASDALTFFYKGKEDERGDRKLDLEEQKLSNDRRAAQYDAKTAGQYFKPPETLTVVGTDMNGKPEHSAALGNTYSDLYTSMVQSGAEPMSAANEAQRRTLQLKDLAAKRVSDARAADKKSMLTIDQAVGQINAEVRRAQAMAPRAPADQSAPPGAPAPSNYPQNGTNAAKQAAARVSPAQQAAADSDMPRILAGEIEKTQALLASYGPRTTANAAAYDRAEADIQGLLREQRGRTGGTAPGPAQAAAQAVAPAQVAAPAAAPSAAPVATTPPAAPVVTDTPIQKLDAAAQKSGWARQKSNAPSGFGAYGMGKDIYTKRSGTGAIEVRSPDEMANQLGLVW